MAKGNHVDIEDVITAIKWALKFENTEILEAIVVQEIGDLSFKVIYLLSKVPTEDEDEILSLISTEYWAQIWSPALSIDEEFKVVEGFPQYTDSSIVLAYRKDKK